MRKCVTVWGLMTMMNYDLCLYLTVNSVIHVTNITYILISLLIIHITEIECEYVGNKDIAEFPPTPTPRGATTDDDKPNISRAY